MTTQTKTATVTEIGRQYVARNQGTLIYSRSQWWRWTGQVWAPVHDLAQRAEFWRLLEEFEAKDHQKPSLSKCLSVHDYVRAKVFVPEEQLDAATNLINLQNGVFNLHDCQLYPHDSSFYLTTVLPFNYDEFARTNMWDLYLITSFVHPRSSTHDQELIDFVQEAIGYSLTTDVSQHVTFWCIGEGANGKGVLFHVLEQLAGTAAIALNVGLLRREQYQLATLAGKRIALCSEASSTENLVEDAMIKALVSGDTMSVRQIRKEPFELHPTAKLWWAMNELPAVSDTSEGFWRRMRVIPFNRSFDENERIPDLKAQLDGELSGIFNWAVRGLQRLRNRGQFDEPTQVQQATEKYRRESNPLRLFIEDKCDVGDTYSVSSSAIYSAYKDWCHDCGFRNLSIKNFKKEMERLAFYATRRNTGVTYDGLKLNLGATWP